MAADLYNLIKKLLSNFVVEKNSNSAQIHYMSASTEKMHLITLHYFFMLCNQQLAFRYVHLPSNLLLKRNGY